MKKVFTDFRMRASKHAPVCIKDAEVKMFVSFKFLGANIVNLSNHFDANANKADQFRRFLRRPRKFGMSSMTLTNFYSCTIESIQCACITDWYANCPPEDLWMQPSPSPKPVLPPTLQLPIINSISRYLRIAANTIKVLSHCRHSLLTPLPEDTKAWNHVAPDSWTLLPRHY